jgi:hypothetical protein
MDRCPFVFVRRAARLAGVCAISRHAATSASANASSLTCSGSRCSRRFGPGRKFCSIAANSAPVGVRIVERLARAIDGRDAALRNQEAHRSLHRVELGGDELADRAGTRRAWSRISVTPGLWR